MIFVYTTCSNKKEAENIARALIEEKLASCANYWSCESLYPWKGELTKAAEYILLLKTEDNLYGLIKERINDLHSYELPAIASFPAQFNSGYASWMQKHLR